RAIVSEDEQCPKLEVDGKGVSMDVRAEPGPLFSSGPDVPAAEFPVRVCEATALPTAKTARLDGAVVRLPPGMIERIVVIGDTGCRIKKDKVQDCEDKWPYPEIALQAAAKRPDLVIHVGDYLYREACSAGRSVCAQNPTGYGWEIWNSDFFEPSKDLL